MRTQGSSQSGSWPPAGVCVPFPSREQDRADSQVGKTAFSGLGGNVGRFFPLPLGLTLVQPQTSSKGAHTRACLPGNGHALPGVDLGT